MTLATIQRHECHEVNLVFFLFATSIFSSFVFYFFFLSDQKFTLLPREMCWYQDARKCKLRKQQLIFESICKFQLNLCCDCDLFRGCVILVFAFYLSLIEWIWQRDLLESAYAIRKSMSRALRAKNSRKKGNQLVGWLLCINLHVEYDIICLVVCRWLNLNAKR